MKTYVKVILILVLLTLIGAFCAFDAFYIAPSRFSMRYETLSSDSISSQLDGVNILFFSDLDYGTYMDESRFTKLVSKINDQSPDIVIFGGDLFDEAYTPDDATNTTVTNLLKSIEAPLGKFAVLGDFDERSEEFSQSVQSILNAGDFEVLINKAITLHNSGSDSITLVGLDNSLSGNTDIENTFSAVSRDTYVLTVVHTPDTADALPEDIVDYCLAGHSHGGQAYWGFGALYTPDGAVNYLRGKHVIRDAFTLDITYGTGTTKKDVRFLCDPEAVIYHLHSTQAAETADSETADLETAIPAETEEPAETEAAAETEDASADTDVTETLPEETTAETDESGTAEYNEETYDENAGNGYTDDTTYEEYGDGSEQYDETYTE